MLNASSFLDNVHKQNVYFITLDIFNIIFWLWVYETHGLSYNILSVHFLFTAGHYHSIMFRRIGKSIFFLYFYSDVNCFSKEVTFQFMMLQAEMYSIAVMFIDNSRVKTRSVINYVLERILSTIKLCGSIGFIWIVYS